MQHRVARAIGGGTGTLRLWPLAIFRCHSTERALIDLTIRGPAKWHAIMFQFDDRWHRLTAHIFDCVLVTEPVGSFDRIVHMPAPIILAHIAECGGNTALCRHSMTPRRKNLRYTSRLKASLGKTERSP